MENFYKKPWYKYLPIIPLTAVALALVFIFIAPGVKLGVDFKGGVLITGYAQTYDLSKLKAALEEKGLRNVTVRELAGVNKGFEIEFESPEYIDLAKKEVFRIKVLRENGKIEEAKIAAKKELEKLGVVSNSDSISDLISELDSKIDEIKDKFRKDVTNEIKKIAPDATLQYREVGAAVSERFLQKAINVMIQSMILLGIAVFFVFRVPIPTFTVLNAAIINGAVALGMMALFGIPLTLASFAGLMAIVGYSIDTDILLAYRVIRSKTKHPEDDAWSALATGLSMSIAATLSFAVLLVLGYITNINTYIEIASVSLFGIFSDILTTWFINGVMIVWYGKKHMKG